MSAGLFAAVALYVLLGALIFRALHRAGFTLPSCAAVSALTLTQAGPVLSLASNGQGLWLSLGVLALAGSAAAFAADRQDAKTIIALGGSLGAIQLLDPAGGIVAAISLPVFAGFHRRRPAETAGLFVLLLFVPCLCAVLLAYSAWRFHFNPAQWLAIHSETGMLSLPLRPAPLDWLFFLPVCPLLLPAFIRRATRQTLAVGLVAAAMTLAGFVSMQLGAVRGPTSFLAALAPIPALAAATWPLAGARERAAIFAAGAAAILSWLVAAGVLAA